MNETPCGLLALDEPAPITVRNANGLSPFLIWSAPLKSDPP